MTKHDTRTAAEFAAFCRRRKLEELLIIDRQAKSFNRAAKIVARMTDRQVIAAVTTLTPQ